MTNSTNSWPFTVLILLNPQRPENLVLSIMPGAPTNSYIKRHENTIKKTMLISKEVKKKQLKVNAKTAS